MGNHAPKYLTLTSSQTLPPIGLCLTHYITAMPVFLLEHIKPFPVSGTLYTVLLCPSSQPGWLLMPQPKCCLRSGLFLFGCVPHAVILIPLPCFIFIIVSTTLNICCSFPYLFITRMMFPLPRFQGSGQGLGHK